MIRFIIAILFVLALIIPILSNALTSEQKTDAVKNAATTDPSANCPNNSAKNCDNCPQRDCPRKNFQQGAVNCAECPNKDCPQRTAALPDCANCPKKAAPAR